MFETLSQIVRHIEVHHDQPALLASKSDGEYLPISTKSFVDRIQQIAFGLRSMGIQPGDRVAILSGNRPEWTLTDFALLCCGAVPVPVYPTLTSVQIRYILNDSGARMAFYAENSILKKLDAVRKTCPKLEKIICFEPSGPEGVLTLDQVESFGRESRKLSPEWFEKSVAAVRPDDLASLIYTSGTTGDPKGVMLTHANFVSNILALRSIVVFTESDRCLSFLPLSHVLERMCTFAFLSQGTSIAYAENVESVAQNLVEVQPTIMVSVPRLFEKIYAGIMDNILSAPLLKRKMFFWAVGVGKTYGGKVLEGKPVSAGLRAMHALAGRLVFSRIIEKTGGRIRFFVSGGAPLAKDIAEFFYAMGLVILEGYGLTETSPVVAVNTFERLKFGSVGPPIPGIDVRTAEDGEILVRGPNVMKGYHNRSEETAEVMGDGWFHTGDIGHFDSEGFLYITDRKKDLIVTAGGKNVAPQIIENMIRSNRYIAGVVVVGARRKFISAVIVPDFEKLESYARSEGISFQSREDLATDPQINDFLLREIDGSCPRLAPFERIKRIVVLPRDFDLGENEVTPTLKIKRHIVEKKFQREIDRLYSD